MLATVVDVRVGIYVAGVEGQRGAVDDGCLHVGLKGCLVDGRRLRIVARRGAELQPKVGVAVGPVKVVAARAVERIG